MGVVPKPSPAPHTQGHICCELHEIRDCIFTLAQRSRSVFSSPSVKTAYPPQAVQNSTTTQALIVSLLELYASPDTQNSPE